MPKPRRLRAVLLAAALLSTSLTLAASPATAEPSGVTTGPVFNNPVGTTAEKRAILDREIELVDGAPAGSTIRMAMYYVSWYENTLSDALIRAHRDRGVNVQLIFDDKAQAESLVPPGPTDPQPPRPIHPYTELVNELGQNAGASSWVVDCGAGRGCIGTRTEGGVHAINHNKFLLFSQTLGTPRVLVQSSANLHTGRDGLLGWNNAYVVAGNDGIYQAYEEYFDDLQKLRLTANGNTNYYDTGQSPVRSGALKAHFYPRAETPGSSMYNDPSEDTMATVLDNVKCFGNSTYGTTDTHRTRIRVGVGQFARPYLADKLVQLDAQGCYVEVAFTYDPPRDLTKPTQGHIAAQKILAKTSNAYGGVIPYYYCGSDATWIHDKYLLIEGNYYNTPDQKVVWTGSHNWTANSLRQSDETVLQIDDPTVHDAYVTNFNQIRTATTHKPANGAPLTC